MYDVLLGGSQKSTRFSRYEREKERKTQRPVSDRKKLRENAFGGSAVPVSQGTIESEIIFFSKQLNKLILTLFLKHLYDRQESQRGRVSWGPIIARGSFGTGTRTECRRAGTMEMGYLRCSSRCRRRPKESLPNKILRPGPHLLHCSPLRAAWHRISEKEKLLLRLNYGADTTAEQPVGGQTQKDNVRCCNERHGPKIYAIYPRLQAQVRICERC